MSKIGQNIINKDLLKFLFKELNKISINLGLKNQAGWMETFLHLKKRNLLLIIVNWDSFNTKYYLIILDLSKQTIQLINDIKINNGHKITSISSNDSENLFVLCTETQVTIFNLNDLINKLSFNEFFKRSISPNEEVKIKFYPYNDNSFGLLSYFNKVNSFAFINYVEKERYFKSILNFEIPSVKIVDFNFANCDDSIFKCSWEMFSLIFMTSEGDLLIKTPIFANEMYIDNKKLAEFNILSQCDSQVINHKLASEIINLSKNSTKSSESKVMIKMSEYLASYQEKNSSCLNQCKVKNSNLIKSFFFQFLILETRPLTILRFAQRGIDVIILSEELTVNRRINTEEKGKVKIKEFIKLQEFISDTAYKLVSFNKFQSFKDIIISKSSKTDLFIYQLFYNIDKRAISLSTNEIQDSIKNTPVCIFKVNHFISYYLYYSSSDNFFLIDEIVEEGFDSFTLGEIFKKPQINSQMKLLQNDLVEIKQQLISNMQCIYNKLTLDSLSPVEFIYPERINHSLFAEDPNKFYKEIIEKITIFKEYGYVISNNFLALEKYQDYIKENIVLIDALNEQYYTKSNEILDNIKQIEKEDQLIQGKQNRINDKLKLIEDKIERILSDKAVIGYNKETLKALKQTLEALKKKSEDLNTIQNVKSQKEKDLFNNINKVKSFIPLDQMGKIKNLFSRINSIKDEARRTLNDIDKEVKLLG